MKPVFTVLLLKGRLSFNAPKKAKAYLTKLEGDRENGRVLSMMLWPWQEKRTISQNKYLWGVIYETISESTGHTHEEIHEFCKKKFLGTKIIEINGEQQEVLRSTTEIPKDQWFEIYIDPIRTWAASDLGIYVPDPNEAQL
jgi:hypothetical protein